MLSTQCRWLTIIWWNEPTNLEDTQSRQRFTDSISSPLIFTSHSTVPFSLRLYHINDSGVISTFTFNSHLSNSSRSFISFSILLPNSSYFLHHFTQPLTTVSLTNAGSLSHTFISSKTALTLLYLLSINVIQ